MKLFEDFLNNKLFINGFGILFEISYNFLKNFQ